MSNFAPQVPKSLIDAVSSVMNESKIDDLKDKKDVEKASDPLAGYKEKEKKEPVKKVVGKYGKEDDKDLEEAKELSPKQKKIASMAGDKNKIDAADLAALRAGKKPECHTCDEETEQVDERHMTDAEMVKREKIVKSMKKGLKGFKQRYGARAKDVMYATATKRAMGEETIEEGTGGPIYVKPFVKLSDILTRLKDAKNLKKAKLVNNIGESPEEVKEETIAEGIVDHDAIAKHLVDKHGKNVTMDHIDDLVDGSDDAHKVDKHELLSLVKKHAKKLDETMMGKAGCTSEDDKKKAELPKSVDYKKYDKPTFLRKTDDWRKSNPAHLPKPTKEEVEPIDEISKHKLVQYIDKATQDVHHKAMAAGSSADKPGKSSDFIKSYQKSGKRQAGITKAAVKLSREETESIDEISKATLGSYIGKSAIDFASHQVQAHKAKKQADMAKHLAKGTQRFKGILKATNKMRYEEVDLDEASVKKLTAYKSANKNRAQQYTTEPPELKKEEIQFEDKKHDQYPNDDKGPLHIDPLNKGIGPARTRKNPASTPTDIAQANYQTKRAIQTRLGKVPGYAPEKSIHAKKSPLPEEVELDETAVLDKYIKSMGYDPKHIDKNKKVMFAKTNAFKNFASHQKSEALYDGGIKGTQDADTHMSPGVTARE